MTPDVAPQVPGALVFAPAPGAAPLRRMIAAQAALETKRAAARTARSRTTRQPTGHCAAAT